MVIVLTELSTGPSFLGLRIASRVESRQLTHHAPVVRMPRLEFSKPEIWPFT